MRYAGIVCCMHVAYGMRFVRIMDSMHIVRIMRIVRVVFEAIVAAETACSRHALGKDGYRVMDGFSNDELPRATRMRVRTRQVWISSVLPLA